jgi:hypothetical protein
VGCEVRNRILALAGLVLVACGAPIRLFGHYFVDEVLGKCVASGVRNTVNESAFEVSSGAIVCLRTPQTDSGVDSE